MELYIDPLLADGRDLGADAGLVVRVEVVPEVSGGVRHNPSPCSTKELNSVIACEVRFVGPRGGWGTRVVAARGMRRAINS